MCASVGEDSGVYGMLTNALCRADARTECIFTPRLPKFIKNVENFSTSGRHFARGGGGSIFKNSLFFRPPSPCAAPLGAFASSVVKLLGCCSECVEGGRQYGVSLFLKLKCLVERYMVVGIRRGNWFLQARTVTSRTFECDTEGYV